MHYFPVFLTAEKINALIVGGGEVAARKIELLLKTPAKITLMSAHVSDSVNHLLQNNAITWLAHDYEHGQLAQFNLVIAATDNRAVNAEVYNEAEQLNILVNVVDEPALCSYITPAIIDRSPMIVALCSSGQSPILLRMLREKIEKMLPDGYGRLADFSGRFRDTIKHSIAKLSDRRKFWEQALSGTIGQLVLDNREPEAEKALTEALNKGMSQTQGQIHIVFCHDCSPDQLTLKAHRAMQFADSLVFDDAIDPQFIEYVRRDAEKFSAKNIDVADFANNAAAKGKVVIYLVTQEIKIESELAVFYHHCGR